DEIVEDIEKIPSATPPGEWFMFPRYNAQSNRWSANAAGYLKAGPTRPPYYLEDLPDSWKKASEAHAAAWKELRKKYARVSA
ncbi:MAG TPA: hypothetical protein VFB90_02315, partial [Dehalococcoidia bacterium]|nr:hypothetical protein [Dehalococcoidia bacterium]